MNTNQLPPTKLTATSYSGAGCLPVVLFIGAGICLYLLFSGWSAYDLSQRLQTSGLASVNRTCATEHCDDDGCTTSYWVDYVFSAPDGYLYRESDSVDATTFADQQPGDSWPILYDATHPADFQSTYRYRAPAIVMQEMRFNLLAAVLCTIITACLFLPKWLARRNFRRESCLSQGVITRLWQTITEDPESGSTTHYWLAYTFPEGQETQQTISKQQWHDHQQGDQVVIRYLASKPAISQIDWQATL